MRETDGSVSASTAGGRKTVKLTCIPCSTQCTHHLDCDSSRGKFRGVHYDPHLAEVYAHEEGCIPSSVSLNRQSPVYLPWRFRPRSSREYREHQREVYSTFNNSKNFLENNDGGHEEWAKNQREQTFRGCDNEDGKRMEGPDCEIIVIDQERDARLASVVKKVSGEAKRLERGDLVEYLLQVVRDVFGDYGLENGPTMFECEAKLLETMVGQGHNFVLLCSVPNGLCRHKALLFKVLADVVGLSCALVTGYSNVARHQWNIITLSESIAASNSPSSSDKPESHDETYLIDPTSPYFTWTRHGSGRAKGYRTSTEVSFGHLGFTQRWFRKKRDFCEQIENLDVLAWCNLQP
ncbi:ethylene-responsive protein kinase Le-CTR1-domain-containing protein [Fimicolochytrium jonesii]|uniref:ethylene-responsive protein kinase Le-CTR1-domain-containing protein n=1 Tax=Fimicolochytrium jonesii TaxID=1396493 RepID=UPI0022FE759C|nr:ethylene-responsive protein kinase Le-CTR1-domain-containing protein [Fimicolochytrium jonesii]KAI8826092.1 ethylene-responsive protein kinase Le-CTR1-domain-containing protein [Fimicolochytrium jonesii]